MWTGIQTVIQRTYSTRTFVRKLNIKIVNLLWFLVAHLRIYWNYMRVEVMDIGQNPILTVDGVMFGWLRSLHQYLAEMITINQYLSRYSYNWYITHVHYTDFLCVFLCDFMYIYFKIKYSRKLKYEMTINGISWF